MSVKWKDSSTDRLCEAILCLKTQDEMYRFLEDVGTIGELKALAQRLEVARLLHEGLNYGEISRMSGASSVTISRTKKALDYGTDGRLRVLERLKARKEDAREVEQA